MPPVSPQLNGTAIPASPRSSSGSQRPSILKRNSSQGIARTTIRSPGSELDLQPLRHAVRPKGHARVVLPRNHSSGRNLAKLARQAAAGEANITRLHTRTRSHEGDTEIRLPGSLDDTEVRPSTLRRNLTSSNLPRNSSHTKLKKNHSHGHLQRLGTAKDLAPLTLSKQKAPLSPGLRGKSKRPKSLDWGLEKDLHEREIELLQAQQDEKRDGPKKVGFDIGSDEEGDAMNMEGSGLDEGEWTEESNSVSPYSTRANTANNSRRASVHERPPERSSLSHVTIPTVLESTSRPISPRTIEEPQPQSQTESRADESTDSDETAAADDERHSDQATPLAPPNDIVAETIQQPAPALPPAVTRSPLHAAKEHPNPTTQLLLRRNSNQLPAPALVSNVTAVDDARSMKGSPSTSLRSGTTVTVAGEGEDDELVSRFIPASTSNGSGTTTNMQNTPKSGSFTAPNEVDLHTSRDKLGFGLGPVSPGSTVSGSSGAATPALGRSRIELKMLQEKALADLETAAERGPVVPAHVYDRRNETLKSYLQLAALQQAGGASASLNTPLSLGPEIFQGRFKAVNTELKVVQKFRSPVAESVSRLQIVRGSKLNNRKGDNAAATSLRLSKSAVSLPVRDQPRKETHNVLPTTTPPDRSTEDSDRAGKPSLTPSKSSLVIRPTRRTASRGVSFVGADVRKDVDRESGEFSLDDIAADLWESVLG